MARTKQTFPLTLYLVADSGTVDGLRERGKYFGSEDLAYELEDVLGVGSTVREALDDAEERIEDDDLSADDVDELTLLKLTISVERPVDVERGTVKLS